MHKSIKKIYHGFIIRSFKCKCKCFYFINGVLGHMHKNINGFTGSWFPDIVMQGMLSPQLLRQVVYGVFII